MATKQRPPEPPEEEDRAPKPKHMVGQTYSDELEFRRARYAHIERQTDALGRVIGVRRMKLSERTRLTAMTPDLGGMDEMQNPNTGAVMLVPQRGQYFIVAMVCEINGTHIPFARNRGELDAVLDRLDQEGLDAASEAVSRILAADAEEGSSLDQAKNLSGTPGIE